MDVSSENQINPISLLHNFLEAMLIDVRLAVSAHLYPLLMNVIDNELGKKVILAYRNYRGLEQWKWGCQRSLPRNSSPYSYTSWQITI